MTRQSPTERATSFFLVMAALAITSVLLYREFVTPPPASDEARQPRFFAEWQSLLPAGRLVGNDSAPVQIAIFSDLECSFCRQFHESLKTVAARHPDGVAYTFIHFPLLPHNHALQAAQTAECASRSGRFSNALDFIFANQDSLGRQGWHWFARGSGVVDSSAFADCLAEPLMPEMIQRGLAAGARAGVTGTPVVYLNGWRYPGAPSDAEFARAVDDLIAGRQPYDNFPLAAVDAQRAAAVQR